MVGIRVRIHTLGCKLNYAESSTYARQFEQLGATIEESSGQPVDIEVVNSCAVTEQAQRKARQLLRRVSRENPRAVRVLVGCYADLAGAGLMERGMVSLSIPRRFKGQLASLAIAQHAQAGMGNLSCTAGAAPELFFPAYSLGGRTRAFLKVQDGCDYKCSYCAIPLARGGSRSSSVAEVMREAVAIVERGVKEIVLTGVNTGEFGREHGESLGGLLRELSNLEGLHRIRVSSIEPNLLTDELLATMAELSTVMPHLHIPLQSGSAQVLRFMRRRYTPDMYVERLEKARMALGDPFVGVDVIVGFPGEDEACFEATVGLLRAVRPSYLHVFPYSPRPDTPAALMGGRPSSEEVARRVQILLELSGKLHAAYCKRYVGSEQNVLTERTDSMGTADGYTENYIRVQFKANQRGAGEIVRVRLDSDMREGAVWGEEIEKDRER